LYDDIHVLFIKQSERQHSIEQTRKEDNGLTEEIIYLPKKPGVLGKFTTFRQWKKIYQEKVAQIISRENPSLLHVHVPWKAGLIAVWVKKKFGIPFLLTEHWGIYNRVVADNIHTRSILFRMLLKQIYHHALGFLSVSRYLAEGVNNNICKKDYAVIPNVVDTSFFYPSDQKHERFTFIHVSNMVALKNVGGIINAFASFLQMTHAEAQLVLVGTLNDECISIAQELGLHDQSVFFRGEVAYADVASEMRKAHVFVMNSDIENSPCVIGEALCSGLPVIATDVGGIPELVDEKSSILIPPQTEEKLAEAFSAMYNRYEQISVNRVTKAAQARFSYQSVGKLFSCAYRNNPD
jgi:glycosyltransferase involved in cell wall biosynthesis